jgi:hypothetical protein
MWHGPFLGLVDVGVAVDCFAFVLLLLLFCMQASSKQQAFSIASYVAIAIRRVN